MVEPAWKDVRKDWLSAGDVAPLGGSIHMGVSVPAPAALNAISVVATHSRQVSVYHVKGKVGAYRFICKLGIPSVSVGPQLPRETNNEQKDNTLLFCRTPTSGVTFPLL